MWRCDAPITSIMKAAARSRSWRGSLLLVIAAAVAASCSSPEARWTENDGGVTRWIEVPEGRLKTRIYTGNATSQSPILVLVLHGDLPDPPPSYQYEFARAVTDRTRKAIATDVVAAGVLRPGYRDPTGDRSSGDMGGAVADNYTPEVIDAVLRAARELAKVYNARATILVGHSGGAAITADLLGRHPGVAQGAVLIGCGCDPPAWRKKRRAQTGNPVFDGATRSLLPLDLAQAVAPKTIVRLIVGKDDDVAPPAYSLAYAMALRKHGIDVSVEVLPGLGHNILFATPVFNTVAEVLMRLSDPPAR